MGSGHQPLGIDPSTTFANTLEDSLVLKQTHASATGPWVLQILVIILFWAKEALPMKPYPQGAVMRHIKHLPSSTDHTPTKDCYVISDLHNMIMVLPGPTSSSVFSQLSAMTISDGILKRTERTKYDQVKDVRPSKRWFLRPFFTYNTSILSTAPETTLGTPTADRGLPSSENLELGSGAFCLRKLQARQ